MALSKDRIFINGIGITEEVVIKTGKRVFVSQRNVIIFINIITVVESKKIHIFNFGRTEKIKRNFFYLAV